MIQLTFLIMFIVSYFRYYITSSISRIVRLHRWSPVKLRSEWILRKSAEKSACGLDEMCVWTALSTWPRHLDSVLILFSQPPKNSPIYGSAILKRSSPCVSLVLAADESTNIPAVHYQPAVHMRIKLYLKQTNSSVTWWGGGHIPSSS